MDLDLRNRVILVTGGGSGIGQAITQACLDEHARVIVVGRMTEAVESFQQAVKAAGSPCQFITTELGEIEQCRRAVDTVQDQYGRLDGLVNNAGVNDGIGLAKGSPQLFLQSLEQHLVHYYSMAHFALPMLKESKGTIVNISSKVAFTGQGGTSAYAAAKGAQLSLTREWAAELLPFGVRVNSVVPAEVLTPLYKQWIATHDAPEAQLRHIEERIPLGHRFTLASEIAATVVFLLSSKQSGHTTAQHVFVDGGYTHLDRALT